VVLEPFASSMSACGRCGSSPRSRIRPAGFQWIKLRDGGAAPVTWGLSWMRWRYECGACPHRLHPGNTLVVWFMWASVFIGSAASWLVVR